MGVYGDSILQSLGYPDQLKLSNSILAPSEVDIIKPCRLVYLLDGWMDEEDRVVCYISLNGERQKYSDLKLLAKKRVNPKSTTHNVDLLFASLFT